MLEIITLSTCLKLLITSKISIAYWDLKQESYQVDEGEGILTTGEKIN